MKGEKRCTNCENNIICRFNKEIEETVRKMYDDYFFYDSKTDITDGKGHNKYLNYLFDLLELTAKNCKFYKRKIYKFKECEK